MTLAAGLASAGTVPPVEIPPGAPPRPILPAWSPIDSISDALARTFGERGPLGVAPRDMAEFLIWPVLQLAVLLALVALAFRFASEDRKRLIREHARVVLVLVAVLPVGAAWAGVADTNAALLAVVAVSSLVLAGGKPDAFDASAALALVGPVLFARSLSLQTIVESQRYAGIPLVLVQPLAFAVFAASVLGRERVTFARAAFGAGVGVTVFLGGWWMPGMERAVGTVAWVLGNPYDALGDPVSTTVLYSVVFVLASTAIFLAKVFAVAYAARALPRVRFEAGLAWRWLVPAALANVALTAVLVTIALPARQGGLLAFMESTPWGLRVNGPVGYTVLVGTAFLVTVPAVWGVLRRINGKPGMTIGETDTAREI